MATSTSKMPFNHYQNGKHGTLPQNLQKDMEVTQDMHLKMSKKIAQLTKVIYALNTKNDEHEAILQGLKEQHEEEMQQILAETRTKIEYYANQLGGEADSQKRVAALEKRIQDTIKEKTEAIVQFDIYKRQIEERELRMKTEHAQKVLSMSHEVLNAKTEFETKMKLLDSLKEKYAVEKEDALDRLRKEYDDKIENLLSQSQSQNIDLATEKEKLESEYRQQITNLHEHIESLTKDRSKLSEEYEGKLEKAQAFYEKELEAVRKSQNSSFETQVQSLLEEQEKMKKDFAFQESQSKLRIDDLIQKLSQCEEEMGLYKAEMVRLESSLENKDADSKDVHEQLRAAKKEAAHCISTLREVEGELAAVRQRCDQQAQDLLKKSTEVGELEATRLQNESTIGDLQGQVNKLQDRLQWLESVKRTLESQNQLQTKESSGQLRTLEQALEELSIEKQKLLEKYERDIKASKESGSDREGELVAQHKAQMSELMEKHRTMSEENKLIHRDEIKRLKQELDGRFETETSRLTSERDALLQDLDHVKAELTARAIRAEDEVKRLTDLVKESEQGLTSTTSEVKGLRDTRDKLQAELEKTQHEQRSLANKVKSLESDKEKLKTLNESQKKEAEADLKLKLENLTQTLDSKWLKTLKKECDKLQKELTEQKEEDKRAAIQQLILLKDEEIAAQKKGWENKLQQLLKQISELQDKLSDASSSQQEEIDRVRKEAEAETRRLTDEMVTAADDYANKISKLENMYKEEIRKLTLQKDSLLKNLEEDLKKKHVEDMQAQMLSHKTTLASTKQQAEQRRLTDMEALKRQQEEESESIRLEMQQLHMSEMDEAGRSHHLQLQAARMELERAIELSRQKEGEHAMKASELRDDIRIKEEAIKSLEKDISKLSQGLKELSQELEKKGKEVLRVRSEANHSIKAREEQLRQELTQQIGNMELDYMREKQDMLAEFGKAQELLKDKISQLQIMLEEAEERYMNRESRDEDLEQIENLQDIIIDKERQLKKLMDDKQFYQMELVNRETNFNKVFNSAPNVGVMNPLQAPKKKKSADKGAMKFNSSPALSTFGGSNNRLAPLPNSPIHDEKLNHARPLPPAPTTKKFVK